METKAAKATPTDYLAEERTFLAWIRTALSLMGFGFVVARFGLFLRELQIVQRTIPGGSSGLSLWFGTGLIALGIFVSLSSSWQHARRVRAMSRGQANFGTPSKMAIAVAILLALLGTAMAAYLLSMGRL